MFKYKHHLITDIVIESWLAVKRLEILDLMQQVRLENWEEEIYRWVFDNKWYRKSKY